MGITCRIGRLVETQTEVYCSHRTLGDIVYLTLQERVECAVHGESTGIPVGEIHARSEHGHSKFSALFHTHGRQFVLDGHIIRSVKGKFQSHIVERLGHLYTTLEVYTAATCRLGSHKCLHLFGSSQIETRIHDITRKFNVASLLDGECLEGDDRQLIFHFSPVEGVSSE